MYFYVFRILSSVSFNITFENVYISYFHAGYTLSMWLKFENVAYAEEVYLSNGGQNENSHGVAMLYQIGRLVWIFRFDDGREWRVAAYDILLRQWYHVAVTWLQNKGLLLYINGEKVAREDTPAYRYAFYCKIIPTVIRMLS